jgi:hypothetical protein
MRCSGYIPVYTSRMPAASGHRLSTVSSIGGVSDGLPQSLESDMTPSISCRHAEGATSRMRSRAAAVAASLAQSWKKGGSPCVAMLMHSGAYWFSRSIMSIV